MKQIDLKTATFLFLLVNLLLLLWASTDKQERILRKEQVGIFLGALGGIALVLTIYDRNESIKREEEAKRYKQIMDDLKNQKDNFVEPLSFINSNYPESLKIYNEMYNYGLNPPTAQVNPIKEQMVEESIALSTFQIVENFLTIVTLTIPSTLIEWLSRLLVWFTSPTLQKYYQKYKGLYSDDTTQFVDNIILNSNILKEEIQRTGKAPSKESIRALAQNITFTPRI
jgi:hypothetical protein